MLIPLLILTGSSVFFPCESPYFLACFECTAWCLLAVPVNFLSTVIFARQFMPRGLLTSEYKDARAFRNIRQVCSMRRDQLAGSVKSYYHLHLTLGVDIITVGGAHQDLPRVQGRAIVVQSCSDYLHSIATQSQSGR